MNAPAGQKGDRGGGFRSDEETNSAGSAMAHETERGADGGVARRRLEVVFTLLTLASLLASLSAERLGHPSLMRAFDVLAYVAGGWFGLIDAVPGLRQRRLDINFLMVVAALGAASINQWHEGATLLFLFSLSNTLQAYALHRARNAIGRLMKLRPTDAVILEGGRERRAPIELLKVGDRILVRPGELIAADGIVRQGRSDVNQATITGESAPVDKAEGDVVFAGTLNGAGALEIEVTRPARDSTLAKIILLVEEAEAHKARTQRFLETFEGRYAWGVVIGATLAVFVPWLVMGRPFSASFYQAMVLLVVASPCALVISTPAAILAAIATGARRGVLFKGGAYLETLAEVRAVAFDKTGTLTTGRLRVTDVVPSRSAPSGFTAERLLAIAASLESRSEHPIARAILAAARERGIELPRLDDFKALMGQGVFARMDGYLAWLGGERLYREHGEEIPGDIQAERIRLESEGKTVLMLHRELRRVGGVGEHEEAGGWLGLIAVADTMRPDAAETIRSLRKLGVSRVIMLTGDNPAVAAAVARAAGVDEFHADLLPEEKVAAVRRLCHDHGTVMMIGDGVNDAPALAAAHIGVAMGAAGSDVALETADVVLMADDLSRIPLAIDLSRRARRIIWQNINFALAVILLLVIGAFGFALPLPLGVVGHEGSTLLVVANSLRLLSGRSVARGG